MIERISYNTILDTMKNEFETLSGIPIDNASDVAIRMKVLAGQLYGLSSQANWLFEQVFPQTATGARLDELACMRGIERNAATYASGTVNFYRNISNIQDIEIPQGTICATAETDGKQYRTTQAVTLEAANEYVAVEVTALGPGKSYNAAPDTVTVPVNPPSGIDAVTNPSAITYGREAETDESLRKRLLNSYLHRSNGSNAAYYRELAFSVSGVLSANVIPVARGAGTVDVVLDVSGATSIEKQAVVSAVNTLIQNNRELGTDIDVLLATERTQNFAVNVKLKNGVSLLSATGTIRGIVSDYFDSLGVGENIIIADVGSRIFASGFFENYSILLPSCDTSVGADEIIRSGSISVGEMQ